MEIKLERNISVKSYEAIMEIASFNKDYDFLLPVLKLEEEGGITAEQINTKLLNKIPNHIMGKRLLDRIEQYKLIEKGSSLIKKESDRIEQNSLSEYLTYYLSSRGERLLNLLKGKNFWDTYYDVDEDLLKSLFEMGLLNPALVGAGSCSKTKKCESLLLHSWPYTPKDKEENQIFISLESMGFLEKNEQNSSNISFDYNKNQDYNYTLTEIGRKALEIGKIPIPEKGLFVIYTTEDSLFREKMIACEPKSENKRKDFKEKSSKYSQNDNQKNNTQKSKNPEWLKQIIKSLQNSPKIIELDAQNREEIQLINIEGEVNNSEQIKKISINLILSSKQSPQMEVYTSTSDKRKNPTKEIKSLCQPVINLSLLEILKKMVAEHASDIIEFENEPALLIKFSEIKNNPSEINSGKKSLKIKSPAIEGFGTFNDVSIQNIKILPKTLEDAISWSNYLISSSINYYIDRDSYNALCEKVIQRFKERFEHHELMNGVHSYDELKSEIIEAKDKNRQKYWYFTAPEILTFKRVK
ncbi:hypothetical protein J2128_001943 [Methanomicrobium sp. W14]|uniref:hypothetical protein n=1 Tax=Methanomicrobium sp. W14 TaxID=2817839 RepID=UPI001AE7CCEC|nr:hypothetical protein [Methanomicrobium sp. W14]MBP2133977.1 hypothetical protein [Methanomicrobium sp. W14]